MRDSTDLRKKKLLETAMDTDDYVSFNGNMLRMIGVFAKPWLKAQKICPIYPDRSESEIYVSLDYLQISGFIKVRLVETKEEIEVSDFDLDEIEIRLLPEGEKILRMIKTDELVKII